MCGTSSARWNYGVVHDPLVVINFPVGSSLDASLAAHLSFLGGTFFVAGFSDSQPIRVWYDLWSVSILCQISRRSFLNVALSIESLRLVYTLLPRLVYLLPSGSVGKLVKSLHF